MKTIQRRLVILLVPVLAPIALAAETVSQTDTSANTPSSSNASNSTRSDSWRASEFIGTNVRNEQGETIGEVKDLIIDLKTEEVVAVIISAGGFLGIGDTLSSVPVSTLRYDGDAKALKISLSKSQLERQPQFNSGSWPDVNDDSYNSKFRGERDRGDVKPPDNTANNENEMKKHQPLPLDQGNNESDLNLTKDIRSEVMKAELSFNAKNIKIITNNGNVTLRGVVESDAEHQAVLKLVRAHAAPSKITDDLKVTPK